MTNSIDDVISLLRDQQSNIWHLQRELEGLNETVSRLQNALEWDPIRSRDKTGSADAAVEALGAALESLYRALSAVADADRELGDVQVSLESR